MNLFIIILTVATSIYAFSNRTVFHKLKFNAAYIKEGEWYRFFTGALVHADYMHLAFNMLALWFAGEVAETFFIHVSGGEIIGKFSYLAFYVLAIPMSSLYTYEKYKNNSWYNAVGASGAVSAVLFCFVLCMPWVQIYLFMIIPMKAWMFGILYLVASWYMARKGNDNIGHDAHFFGAVFGILVTLIMKPSLGTDFINYLLSYIP